MFLTPKVATTTFRRVMTQTDKDTFDATPLEASTPEVLASDEFSGFRKFAVVRSPWSRVVSCWSEKVAHPRNDRVRAMLSRYEGLEEGMPFDAFARWLVTEHGRDEVADRHWASQSLILGGDPTNDLDFIGRYEDLQRDFAEICRRIGIEPIPLPTTNTSASGSSRTADRHLRYYDTKLIRLIGERYEKDVRLFGFEPPRL